MNVAGIWETWHAGKPDERRSFSILTTAANEFMRGIHDRMPVILDRSAEEAWLDPQFQEAEGIQRLMRPCPSSWLAAVQVSPLINAAKNNTPDVLRPFLEEPDKQRTLALFE
jgi:putative SOS response-associated peptidase YedK